MSDSDNEGFVGERSFDYQLLERQEQECVYRLLPEANKLLNKKPPPTEAARVIRGFCYSKFPRKLEHTQDIEKPIFTSSKELSLSFRQTDFKQNILLRNLLQNRVSELSPPQQHAIYRRYEYDQTMEQRYSSAPVYSKYAGAKKGPYKHFSYSGKYVSVWQLLDLESQDCHQLQEVDYTLRNAYNQLHNQQTVFDSKFQSGNLLKAFQVGENQYDILVENDTNTNGYNQWFYFMMANVPQGTQVKINIVNLQNCDSFFNYGMSPAILSLKRFKSSHKTWYRGGSDIVYQRGNLLRSKTSHVYYFTLSFTFTFDYFEDVVYFATNFPYTYSKLNHQIGQWQQNLKMQKEVLCISPSQNFCWVLTVGNPIKPVVFITARQHPGETVSNYVLEGIMEHLSQNKEVLQQFQFKIVPMVNVDGCIYGNFRTNITGVDINRKWNDPDKLFTPQVWSVRELMKEVGQKKKITHFIDLHGHSRNLGSFIYSSGKGKRSKFLPYLLGEYNQSFDRTKCTFGISPSKEDTARAYVYEMFRSCQSITIQSSFYGFKNRDGELIDYYPEHLKKLGNDLLKCILLINSKAHLPITQQQQYWTNSSNNSSLFQGKFTSGNQDEGSDQDPTADQIEEIQKKVAKIKQSYKLEVTGSTTVSSCLTSPLKLIEKPHKSIGLSNPSVSSNLTKSKSLRKRITSSTSRPGIGVTHLATSTVLKKQLPNMKIALFDVSQQLSQLRRKNSSRSRFKVGTEMKNVSESNLKLAKLMLGLPKNKY